MKQLVLAGAGHAHAQVLLAWAKAPLPGVNLTVVSPHALAPYSGMVPGWLAGRYRFESICIDFQALCRAAGAHWVGGSVARLDASRRQLWLDDGQSLHYDVLSLNIGSTLRPPDLPGSLVLPLRPLGSLANRWNTVLRGWQQAPPQERRPLAVTAVGAGAAGFESVMAVVQRLRRMQPERTVLGRLVSRGDHWLKGASEPARRRARRALERADISLQLNQDVSPQALAHASPMGQLVLWATGAQAHDWLTDESRRPGLAVTPDGFVRVDNCLRSVSHPNVLASGDCAHWDSPLPDGAQGLAKAGVFAVRMGPLLWHNLRAVLSVGEPRPYRPQRDYLVLLSTADGSAIASRGRWGFSGPWVWRWKDKIDREFVGRFR
ncbi:MAG: FAD-dependent oxidoreductase [Rubrivivax sp.]|jgi:pyridine nucleotide-disulfide oxidoreductase family protein|nr:FAD-dependent oxidoreductase [Rubrivivax sp.]